MDRERLERDSRRARETLVEYKAAKMAVIVQGVQARVERRGVGQAF